MTAQDLNMESLDGGSDVPATELQSSMGAHKPPTAT